jgi:peptidoglycan/LPS O-acetylase OafA/YrhL
MSVQAEVTPLPTSRSYIAGLDGIRALAVLTVFLYHAQILPHVPGELATTIFFFLSGFLITTLFVREWKKTGTINLGSFYYRRALRTLPPLYVALGVALGAAYFLHVGGPLNPWKAGGNFLSYTNYALAMTNDNSGFLPGTILLWSLAVDEHYYLVFAPLFKAAIKRIPMRAIIGTILFLCAAALLWRVWLVHSYGEVTHRETMASDTRMDSILWGSLLALWRNPTLEPAKAKSLTKPVWIAAAILALGFVQFSHNWFVIGTVGYTIQGIALMPLFSLAMLQGGKGALKFLQWPWLMWVSRASYPLYLLQWIMISICEQYVHGPRVLQMAVAAVLTLTLGAALHTYLELPLAALRKSKAKAKLPPMASIEALRPAAT